MTEMSKFINKRLRAVVILAALGVLVAGYLAYRHYANITGGKICNISDRISCDIVNKSIYAEIFGVPVSLIGAIGYAFIAVVSFGLIKDWNFQRIWADLRKGLVVKILFWIVGAALLFSFYLTYAEVFILHAYCPFCVLQQIIILVIFFLLASVRYTVEEDRQKGGICEFC